MAAWASVVTVGHVDRRTFAMEIRAHLLDEFHDALVALENALLALGRQHGELSRANALEVDEEHAAQLAAMSIEERTDARVAVLRRARRHKPDVMTQKLVVAHIGNGLTQLLLRRIPRMRRHRPSIRHRSCPTSQCRSRRTWRRRIRRHRANHSCCHRTLLAPKELGDATARVFPARRRRADGLERALPRAGDGASTTVNAGSLAREAAS